MNALRGIFIPKSKQPASSQRERGLINVLPHVGLYVPVFKNRMNALARTADTVTDAAGQLWHEKR